MISVKNLSAGYPGCPVLSQINLEIESGCVTVIAGPNGCGKTTLLKTLAGIVPCSSGEILYEGQPVSTLTPRQLAQKAAYLPQNRQTPDITALRMVLHGRFPYLSYPRRYRPLDLQIARNALTQMGIAELADRPLQTLSGGTRQKVYIAMALAQDTPVVLMDEPTTFLDPAHQLQTIRHARFLAREGKALVLVLHDLPLALQSADKLIVMDKGRIIQSGGAQSIWDSGCLSRVFGLSVNRFQTPDGWQYYYKM